MKRWTNWPQAWLGELINSCPEVLALNLYLGLAMNWGLPTAWLMAAPADIGSVPMWALTFGTFCWTILYDTIYACQVIHEIDFILDPFLTPCRVFA